MSQIWKVGMSVHKKCMFCREINNRIAEGNEVFFVNCLKCNATGPFAASEEAAVAMWVNTRDVSRTWPDDDDIGGVSLAAEITLDHLAAGMIKGFILACCYDDAGRAANILTAGNEDAIEEMLNKLDGLDFHCGSNLAAPDLMHIDAVAVTRFAAAMRDKLKFARESKDRGGWWDRYRCDVADLKTMLAQHLAKGDMVDTANLAMMIWCREYLLDHNFNRLDIEAAIANLRTHPLTPEKGR